MMNEEIEYAEMLEVPVSTVNVVQKKRRRKKREAEIEQTVNAPIKEDLIAQINQRLYENSEQSERPETSENTQITADANLFTEAANSEGRLDFEPYDSIDTVRLYSSPKKRRFWRKPRLSPEDFSLEETENTENIENGDTMYALNDEKSAPRGVKIALATEFALACAFCGAIFLTNVFMPHSAINTFFRSLNEPVPSAKVDTRSYDDFILSPVVSELSDAELTLSQTGVLSFKNSCCVYPSADGKIAEVARIGDNNYSVKIQYSDSFTGIINGLSEVYYQVGDKAYANIPVGYSNGEGEVQVTMYSDGELLNCFELTEENCLAWVKAE